MPVGQQILAILLDHPQRENDVSFPVENTRLVALVAFEDGFLAYCERSERGLVFDDGSTDVIAKGFISVILTRVEKS
jgi:hypothetical protein